MREKGNSGLSKTNPIIMQIHHWKSMEALSREIKPRSRIEDEGQEQVKMASLHPESCNGGLPQVGLEKPDDVAGRFAHG